MPGPAPKHPALRQRQNRVAGAATLDSSATPQRPPPLPKLREWHRLTRAWWRDVWRSPMAAEYLQSDYHGLLRLADLVDRYWQDGTVQLAAEIRQQEARFGLSPLDRWRLQWEVRRLEDAERRRPSAPSRERIQGDPRAVLQAVK